MEISQLPLSVQRHAASVLERLPKPESLPGDGDFQAFAEWLISNADAVRLYRGDITAFEAIIPAAERTHFCDDQLRTVRDLSDDDEISDEMRIAFMRSHFKGLLHEALADADLHPGCTALRLSSGGKQVLLAYGIRGYSFSGVRVEWFGLYADEVGFRQWVKERGWLTTLDDYDETPTVEKLAWWGK